MSYGLVVRKESNLRPCECEVTELFTTGVLVDTIREQAMLRSQPAAYPAGQVALYQLSYRRIERRAGLEPATSRLTVEVTAIFTTDRDGDGGEQTMLLPLRRAHSATAFLPAGFEPATPDHCRSPALLPK